MKKHILLFLLILFSITLSFGQDNGEQLISEKRTSDTAFPMKKGKDLEKGTWHVSGTLSAKSNDFSEIDLLVVDVEHFEQRAFDFRFEGSYFFKKNISVGLGLQYGEAKNQLASSFLNNSYERDIRKFNRSYGVVGFIKNYIPITTNKLLYGTNQTELFYSYQNGPSETHVGGVLERRYAKKHNMGISIRPGILVFLTDNFAFDLNIGVLGFLHSNEKVTFKYPENNIPSEDIRKKDSVNKTTVLDFKFDLFKIGFGFSYYF